MIWTWTPQTFSRGYSRCQQSVLGLRPLKVETKGSRVLSGYASSASGSLHGHTHSDVFGSADYITPY